MENTGSVNVMTTGIFASSKLVGLWGVGRRGGGVVNVNLAENYSSKSLGTSGKGQFLPYK